MKNKLKITLNVLNNLDTSRISLVIYHPYSFEMYLKQHGGTTVRLNHLVGFIKPLKRVGVLFPEDLQTLKNTIGYLLEGDKPILLKTITGGYKVWEQGDIVYTSTPRYLGKLKFYSLKSRIYVWITRMVNEEIRLLFKTLIRQTK